MDGFSRDTELMRDLVRFVGTNPAAVARAADVAVTTINRPYNGTAKTRLGRAALVKLQQAFPDFPGWADYLSAISLVADERLPWRGPVPDRDPDLVELNEIDLRFGLGATYLDGPILSEKRHFSRSWLRHFTDAMPEHLFWTIGDGDSMEPTIRSGEVILIDRSQRTPRMGDGIWAVAIGEIGMIKRLHVPERGRIELRSDNERVPPIAVPASDVVIVGRVVAMIRRL